MNFYKIFIHDNIKLLVKEWIFTKLCRETMISRKKKKKSRETMISILWRFSTYEHKPMAINL